MEDYISLSEAMNGLRKQGYSEDFNLKPNGLECRNTAWKATELKVDRVCRFEGKSNPSDQSILYALSSLDGKTKGLLVSGYGIYTEPLADDVLRLLKYP